MYLFLIYLIYAFLAFMAVLGCAKFSSRYFKGKNELYFYCGTLFFIQIIYIVFDKHFNSGSELELYALIGFLILSVLGAFSPYLIILGYLSHGTWDLLHTLEFHSLLNLKLSQVPLAYDIFCVVFDFGIVAYFFKKRKEWS